MHGNLVAPTINVIIIVIFSIIIIIVLITIIINIYIILIIISIIVAEISVALIWFQLLLNGGIHSILA